MQFPPRLNVKWFLDTDDLTFWKPALMTDEQN